MLLFGNISSGMRISAPKDTPGSGYQRDPLLLWTTWANFNLLNSSYVCLDFVYGVSEAGAFTWLRTSLIYYTLRRAYWRGLNTSETGPRFFGITKRQFYRVRLCMYIQIDAMLLLRGHLSFFSGTSYMRTFRAVLWKVTINTSAPTGLCSNPHLLP